MYEHVNEKQRHSHSVACKKRNNSCRFHYPKPPSEKTIIASLTGENANDGQNITLSAAKQVLSTVLDCMETMQDIDDKNVNELLTSAGISSDIYHQCLSMSKATTVILKRTPAERYINYYDADILRLWEANMDLQFVCDPYACVSYIVSYVT